MNHPIINGKLPPRGINALRKNLLNARKKLAAQVKENARLRERLTAFHQKHK